MGTADVSRQLLFTGIALTVGLMLIWMTLLWILIVLIDIKKRMNG
jgi:hypothetical protein